MKATPVWVLPTVIVVATALFLGGVFWERSVEKPSPSVAGSPCVPPDPNAPEGSPAREAAEQGKTCPPVGAATNSTANGSERIFGFDLESNPMVAGAVGLSLAAAAVAALRPRRVFLVMVALAMLAFAALDGAEAIHQHKEGRLGLTLLVVLIGALHLGAAALALAWRPAATATQANP